jgi:hypothetical protein
MNQFSIKIETEDLVKKTVPVVQNFTPDIAKNVFEIIRDNFIDEYSSLCQATGKSVVNQWIGKAIMNVFDLKHKNEHITINEDSQLIKSYTKFYQ